MPLSTKKLPFGTPFPGSVGLQSSLDLGLVRLKSPANHE